MGHAWHGGEERVTRELRTQVEDAFKESVKYRSNKFKKYLKLVIQILKLCTVRSIKAQYAQCTMRSFIIDNNGRVSRN